MKIKLKDELTNQIFQDLVKSGAKVYIVGGFTRDYVLADYVLPDDLIVDVDVEVHNLTLDEVFTIISKRCKCTIQGQFGVIKLDKNQLEIALPRKESSIGQKHQDFAINIDPFMGTYEATIRRDFTMNALLLDVETGEIIDHHHGLDDMNNRTIKHISNKFKEDPLRIMRAIRLSSQLGFTIDESTYQFCIEMLDDLKTVSAARKNQELNKFFLGNNFLIGIDGLVRLLFPYWHLQHLKDTLQSPKYHPEGNVLEHTIQAILITNQLKTQLDTKSYLILMLAALFHDIGKISTTKIESVDKIHSYGHEKVSAILCKDILDDCLINKSDKNRVIKLVKDHMKPYYFDEYSPAKLLDIYHVHYVDKELFLLLSSIDKAARDENRDLSAMLLKQQEIYQRLSQQWLPLFDYITALYQKFDGYYFMNLGYSGSKIKYQQNQVLIKEIKLYMESIA